MFAVDTFALDDEDAIVPFDELVSSEADRAGMRGFYPAFLENGAIDGKTWGISFQRATPVLSWKDKAFAEAGLDPERPPATRDEPVEFAEKLTKRDAGRQRGLFRHPRGARSPPVPDRPGPSARRDGPGASSNGTPRPRVLRAPEGRDVDHHRQPHQCAQQGALPLGRRHAAGRETPGRPHGWRQPLHLRARQRAERKAALGFVRWFASPEMAADWCIATGYVATSPAARETEAMREYAAAFPPATIARDQLHYPKAEHATHENQRATMVFNDGLQAASALTLVLRLVLGGISIALVRLRDRRIHYRRAPPPRPCLARPSGRLMRARAWWAAAAGSASSASNSAPGFWPCSGPPPSLRRLDRVPPARLRRPRHARRPLTLDAFTRALEAAPFPRYPLDTVLLRF